MSHSLAKYCGYPTEDGVQSEIRICQRSVLRGLSRLATTAALLGGLFSAGAQAAVPDRISGSVDSGQMVALKGSVHPLAQAKYDIGTVSGATKINGISIYLKLSAAQQSALNQLLQEQQTPGGPLYHRWLTPAQYASEFGLSSNDVSNIQAWLQRQGFQIASVSSSGNRITFSGTAAQVESAFQTQLHHYEINGVVHMANATPVSVPSAIAGMVAGVRNLTDFRPRPRVRKPVVAHYTASNGTSHYITPDDFATIYDVNSQYNAGYTGSGETIVVVGQSSIEASDIANFRSLSGLPASTPTMTLVPGTGTSEAYSQDEVESDIDVEWSGAVAKGATINFVYVGNETDASVFDALIYAIEENLAPVVSISYGGCEAEESSGDVSALETLFAQANAQGQTIMAASGDNGAADCDVNPGTPGVTATVVNGDEATQGAAVDYPGASVYVTAMGGTEFSEGSGDYWNSTNNSDGGSADNGYIPAEVWNDTSTTNGLDAGGGGKSTLFAKPTWQTGTGVPSDGMRDVPDLSLNASPEHDGYIICSSAADSSSCTNGFADSNKDLNIYGGTSFAAPTFAGLLTLINQQVAPAGQGNVNTLIYAIANSSAGATAFHDVTTGNNEVPCEEGSTGCTPGSTAYTATSTGGEIGYAATTGFDLASGWGSVDEYELAQAFAGQVTTTSPNGSFTLSASNVSVASGSSGASTITVTPSGGYIGTVAFTVTGPTALTSANSCYAVTNATVTGTAAVTGTVTINTTASACPSGSTEPFSKAAAKNTSLSALGGAGGAALASVLLLGFSRKRKRFRSALLGSVLLGAALLGFAFSGLGCGGGSSSSTTSNTTTSTTTVPAGTYTINVKGANSPTGSPSASTTFTLTVS